jgi:hypothetical protein
MSLLDIFRTDAFSLTSLTAAAVKAPFKPARLAQLGLFHASGISTTTALIEEISGRLSLIQTSPRGGPASTIGTQKRTMRSFVVPHLEREARIMAESLQGVRAFGSDSEAEAIQNVINRTVADLRAMHEVTLERHRVSALQGIVLDADGSTLLNLFTAFNVTQSTAALNFSDADLRSEIIAAQRMSEYSLGAEPISGYRALCGDTFFDRLVDSVAVRASFVNQEGAILRADLRKGFEFGGVIWENYRGRVGADQPEDIEDEQEATPFIADEEGYLFPEGTGIFQTYYAPADFMETVNTIGLPIYVKAAPDEKYNRHVDLHSQSNPLCLNLRPRAVVKLTIGS